MKTQKVSIKIEVETLDIASVNGLLLHMVEQIDREVESGMLSMHDGDQISWETSKKDVEF